jgi:hypothetical protein
VGAAAHVLDAASLPNPSAGPATSRSQRAELLLSLWMFEPDVLGDRLALRLGGTAAGRARGFWHEEPRGKRGDWTDCEESVTKRMA